MVIKVNKTKLMYCIDKFMTNPIIQVFSFAQTGGYRGRRRKPLIYVHAQFHLKYIMHRWDINL